MKHLLLLGAGRSAPSLIQYLLAYCARSGHTLTLGDLDPEAARAQIQGYACAEAVAFDVQQPEQRLAQISRADLVVSLLPVSFHLLAARVCVELGKPLLTASYVSDEIKALDGEARAKGSLILMECGLDPGIDHMSAMRIIHRIRAGGGVLTAFETFTGGLLAPASALDNPWEYKFTWNPRNVVLAGMGGARFIQEGRFKYIPYHRLFRRTEIIHIPGYGFFEGYGNRDSLKYLDIYGIPEVRTLYRGTLRRPGFSKTWDIFVQLGATDDTYRMERVGSMTHRHFINSFLYYDPHNSVELKLAHYMNLDIDGQEMYKLRWLGMFDDTPVGLEQGTPAQILEHILKKRWSLAPGERDMIVMWHKFDYEQAGVPHQIQSHMVLEGIDPVQTAMARTVGLPLGIAARHVLEGSIRGTGVQTPVTPAVYEPILDELEQYGIRFAEREVQPA
ncbi:MAG: saccharopine dehydrogenase family protein [Bacteroidia bacterium]|nr:saccharopine dehydrogenase family protein [Bacteroidia bacterium]